MLKKTLVVASMGVPANLHRVDNVSVNLQGASSTITVASFYDTDAHATGRTPLAFTSINVDSAPADGESLTAFAERVLTQAAPEGHAPVTELSQYSGERYAFAGADIVAATVA